MRAEILAFAVALAVASPVLAKTAPAPAEPDHAGPIPYSELAAVDAKMNGPATPKKKHMAHRKAAPPAAAAATTGAAATTPAK